ncbi:hypothetical protein EC01288_1950, partial [Escherichia coli 0.1288]
MPIPVETDEEFHTLA